MTSSYSSEQRLAVLLGHLDPAWSGTLSFEAGQCRALEVPSTSKVVSVEDAISAIKDGSCLTVSFIAKCISMRLHGHRIDLIKESSQFRTI